MIEASETPDRRCWRYKLGESRVFLNPESVPEGEGWVDSPAKVRPVPEKPQIAPLVAISTPEVHPEPPAQTLTSESPRRSGRKSRK